MKIELLCLIQVYFQKLHLAVGDGPWGGGLKILKIPTPGLRFSWGFPNTTAVNRSAPIWLFAIEQEFQFTSMKLNNYFEGLCSIA